MKGKSKGSSSELTAQTAIRLPPEMLERLRKAAGGRGVGEEIRRRLEASFAVEATAQADLMVPITEAADLTKEFFGDWRQDAFAFFVLKSAIGTILDRHKPSGTAKLKFNPDSIADVIFGVSDTAEQAGTTLAGIVLHNLSKKES